MKTRNEPSSDGTVLHQKIDPSSKLIFAFLGARNIGDFAEQILTAAAVKESLNDYRLAVFYNQDRPYKQQIASLCCEVDILLAGPKGMSFPINIFDIYSGRVSFDDPVTESHHINHSTLILAGNSLPSMCLPSFSHVPRLRIPDQQRARHEAILTDRGLDPNRWFACVYWREPGFNDRPANQYRDILDPSPYMAAIDHIIDDLGGQVVRLGHPTNTKLRVHPDILDIAKMEDSLMTQITAISRARFFISSPSGPLTFGSGFGTPTAVTDNIDISGVWNDDDLLVTQTIITPEGKKFTGRAAFDAGLLQRGPENFTMRPDSGYRYTKNTYSDLIRVTDILHKRTAGCSKWRNGESPARPVRSDLIAFPLRSAVKAKAFID